MWLTFLTFDLYYDALPRCFNYKHCSSNNEGREGEERAGRSMERGHE